MSMVMMVGGCRDRVCARTGGIRDARFGIVIFDPHNKHAMVGGMGEAGRKQVLRAHLWVALDHGEEVATAAEDRGNCTHCVRSHCWCVLRVGVGGGGRSCDAGE